MDKPEFINLSLTDKTCVKSIKNNICFLKEQFSAIKNIFFSASSARNEKKMLEMLNWCKEEGFKTFLLTNCSALNGSTLRNFCYSGLNVFGVWLESTRPELQEYLRPGESLDNILDLLSESLCCNKTDFLVYTHILNENAPESGEVFFNQIRALNQEIRILLQWYAIETPEEIKKFRDIGILQGHQPGIDKSLVWADFLRREIESGEQKNRFANSMEQLVFFYENLKNPEKELGMSCNNGRTLVNVCEGGYSNHCLAQNKILSNFDDNANSYSKSEKCHLFCHFRVNSTVGSWVGRNHLHGYGSDVAVIIAPWQNYRSLSFEMENIFFHLCEEGYRTKCLIPEQFIQISSNDPAIDLHSVIAISSRARRLRSSFSELTNKYESELYLEKNSQILVEFRERVRELLNQHKPAFLIVFPDAEHPTLTAWLLEEIDFFDSPKLILGGDIVRRNLYCARKKLRGRELSDSFCFPHIVLSDFLHNALPAFFRFLQKSGYKFLPRFFSRPESFSSASPNKQKMFLPFLWKCNTDNGPFGDLNIHRKTVLKTGCLRLGFGPLPGCFSDWDEGFSKPELLNEDFLETLLYELKKSGHKNIHLMDRAANLDPNLFNFFLRKISEQELLLTEITLFISDEFNLEWLMLLAGTGLKKLIIQPFPLQNSLYNYPGVEKCRFYLEKILQWGSENSIFIDWKVALGYPGETEDDFNFVKDKVCFLTKKNQMPPVLCTYLLEKGSNVFLRPEKYGIVVGSSGGNWISADGSLFFEDRQRRLFAMVEALKKIGFAPESVFPG